MIIQRGQGIQIIQGRQKDTVSQTCRIGGMGKKKPHHKSVKGLLYQQVDN